MGPLLTVSLFSRRPKPESAEGIAANGRARESVWAYPRPPRIEPVDRRVLVSLGDVTIAASERASRVIETAGAPVVYVRPEDVVSGALRPASGSSFCEWKGSATYFDVVAGGRVARQAAWAYLDPTPPFAAIAGHVSFYPALVDCRLDEEIVQPQPGGFYGGWVTAEITGPIKGDPGSRGW